MIGPGTYEVRGSLSDAGDEDLIAFHFTHYPLCFADGETCNARDTWETSLDNSQPWARWSGVAGTYDAPYSIFRFGESVGEPLDYVLTFTVDPLPASPIPLPASAALLPVGLGAFAAVRRRKRT